MQNTISRFIDEYDFLSNFFYAKTPYCGTWYPTSEHAYQAAKSVKVGQRVKILGCETPKKAKKMGQSVVLRPNWDKIKPVIMHDLVWGKFTNHPNIRDALGKTGDAKLIEGNTWHDNYWGNCTCGRDECEKEGHNVLGQILERVREAIC
jgi:ribA/ribD-fused uncharacterized protein